MGVVFLLYCSRARVLIVQKGAYKLIKQCRTSRSPTLSCVGAFPFIVQGGASIYIYLVLCLGTVGCPSFSPVVGAHSVGQEWVGLILAIFWGKV